MSDEEDGAGAMGNAEREVFNENAEDDEDSADENSSMHEDSDETNSNVDDLDEEFFVLPDIFSLITEPSLFVQNRIYYSVFYPIMLFYHKSVPSFVKKFIEFMILIKVILIDTNN